MSLGDIAAIQASPIGSPGASSPNLGPYDMSSLGIQNPSPVGFGPGGLPVYTGGGPTSFTNPFGADPNQPNWNSPFGQPYDTSKFPTQPIPTTSAQSFNQILSKLMGH